MLHWIGELLTALANLTDDDSTGSNPRPKLDRRLQAMFREELGRFGQLYAQAAEEAIVAGAATHEADVRRFRQRFDDLGRGLLLKIFVTIAESHTRWAPEEFELASDLLHFVWGRSLAGEDLRAALENMVHHTESLSWETLLRPFVTTPALARRAIELETLIHRLANLVAKADGRVSPSEYGALQALQHHIDTQLSPIRGSGASSRAAPARSGSATAQQTALAAEPEAPAERLGASSSPAAEWLGASSSPAPRPPENAVVHAPPAKEPAVILAEALRELDQLVGLDSVKQEVRELADFLKIQEERRRMNLPVAQVALHTLFTGNPGTGKTTLARIMGRILHGLGILQKGHTIEADRSALIAKYAGQTGPKTHELITTALDGVLFIDEAYSLVSEQDQDSFGSEAVATLLKRMEDDRARLVVILAGYPAPMQSLIDSNPGLASRFQRSIEFPDYSAAELEEIFLRMCRQNHYELTKAALTRLRLGLAQLVEEKDERFGNARVVRNLFERAIRRMAARIAGVAPLTRELLTTLEPGDLDFGLAEE